MVATPFPLWPDGASPLVETFTESTAVEASFNGSELREKCRSFPRYQLGASFILDGASELDAVEGLIGQPLLVPAWMHAIQRPDAFVPLHTPGVDRDFYGRLALGGPQSFFKATVDSSNELQGTFERVFPALEMQLTEESFDTQVLSRSIAMLSLSFFTDKSFEAIPAYTGPTSAGLPLLTARHNWTAKPAKQTAFNQNRFDAGNLALIDTRHIKRSVGVRFDLFGLDEIRAFRTFIRQLRGRYQAFRWVAFDGVERTYRLAADSWSLEWRGTHTAGASLRFLELE